MTATVLIAGGGTGGHLMPALAIADAIVSLARHVEPVLVGARRGVEARILPERPYRYYLLSTEPLYRSRWWRNARWPFLALKVMGQARDVLRTELPAVAVGTGGYASGPLLVAAARTGVPLVLQEQNAFPGFTTRRLAGKATQIHLGFPEAAERLHAGEHTRVFTLGNPIAPPPTPRPNRRESRKELGIDPDRPVLLVVGGSQGAQGVNAVVAQAIERKVFGNAVLLWSTGHAAYDRYRAHHAPPHRFVRPFWDPIAEAYAPADLVIARAGAMTTAELCAWGLPAIYIPLPHAAANHQDANAAALASSGAAVRLPENELSVERLGDLVRDLFGSPSELTEMGVAARARAHPKSAENVARSVLSLIA